MNQSESFNELHPIKPESQCWLTVFKGLVVTVFCVNATQCLDLLSKVNLIFLK